MNNHLIPPASKGKNIDIETYLELDSREQAVLSFRRACKRMYNPAIWHKLCGPASAEFILESEQDGDEQRLARQGDYFKIKIPGPGSSAGQGYDWVKVEQIESNANYGLDEESCGMKLTASEAPGAKDDVAAHFFEKGASSTFIIHRKENTVTASYHGRNEVANVDTGKTLDNVRNAAVAMGASAGLSEVQWSSLIKALLQKEIGG